MSKADADNRSNQLNDNNDAYYQSRGYGGRDDYVDDDDDNSCRAFYRPLGPRELTGTEQFLNNHSAVVREEEAARQKKNPSRALCAYLRGVYNYFYYVDLGHGSVVSIRVPECDPDSDHAIAIKTHVQQWLESFPGRESLTVIRVEFSHKES